MVVFLLLCTIWSFKFSDTEKLNTSGGIIRYYDDAACVLRTMFLEARAPQLNVKLSCLPWSKIEQPLEPEDNGISRQESTALTGTFGQAEELRCVIAILRQ